MAPKNKNPSGSTQHELVQCDLEYPPLIESLGELEQEELEAVLDILPKKTITTGFYSYGEISPYHTITDCRLHNQTMTITYISEV